MNVLVSGASGLIGSALVPLLRSDGHDVVRLERGGGRCDTGSVSWDPQTGTLDRTRLTGIEAVVHLAGENIANGRWSRDKKIRIRSSRVDATHLLARTLAELDPPPQTLIAASAIGYYGDRGGAVLDEDSTPGGDFLAEVCREWEAATQPAAEGGIRVVNLRFGVVLSPIGGALATMLTPFRFGVGGPVGTGRQYLSWIAIDDALDAIRFALATPGLSGPVNAVSPNPVTSAEFARALGRVLSRPALLPLPAVAARLLFGEMADALLLSSTRVTPKRLLHAGFQFRFRELDAALRHVLGR